MRYRLTCLTPTLVGDGHRLAPIDYMVWKDQVNVLDQHRIFRLLAKGPRLEGYLTQLKKADKLDFASWGGFAQNFADRRIPFEHPSCSGYWDRAAGESLFIPTFASGPDSRPYLPGSALKGAIRTGLVAARINASLLNDLASQGERALRRPGLPAEDQAVGSPGTSRMKGISVGDSAPVAASSFRVYLLRTSTLISRGGRLELGWKQSPRGSVDGRRPEDSTPVFAEMAAPGTVFEGVWTENQFFAQPEVLRALHWREFPGRQRLFQAANGYAAGLLAMHRRYAELSGLDALQASLESLERRVEEVRANDSGCLLPLGWGAGFLGKTAITDTESEAYRQVLKQIPLYARSIQTGLPFPKTRRVVFLNNQPAALPGWTLLEVAG